MVSVACFAVVCALAVLSLTRKRVFLICGFYFFYAVLTVMDEGDVPHLGPITIYRALYMILAVSIIARFIQDPDFPLRMQRWPLWSYSILLVLLLGSALYSQSEYAFISNDSWNVWSRLVVLLLFWFAACHVHHEDDLKIVAITVAGTALTLSFWVIWSAAQLNFEAYRGGVEIDQNYVSIFVFPGILALTSLLFVFKRLISKLVCALLLVASLFASLILASRGMFVAFFCAVIALLIAAVKRKRRLVLGMLAGMALLTVLILLLPGTGGLLERFREGDINTLDLRTLIWLHSLRHFADSGVPRMIFGQGLASDRVIAGPLIHSLPNYHNDYLKWLMDRGIVGLAAFLFFLYQVGQRTVRTSHPLRPLLLGWLVFFLVAQLTGVLTDLQMFWILMGIIVASCSVPNGARGLKNPAPVSPVWGPSSIEPVSS